MKLLPSYLGAWQGEPVCHLSYQDSRGEPDRASPLRSHRIENTSRLMQACFFLSSLRMQPQLMKQGGQLSFQFGVALLK